MQPINYLPSGNVNAMRNFYMKLERFLDKNFPLAVKKIMPTTNVAQGSIMVSTNQLTTYGLSPCSAVATRLGKNLLGHIDAVTNTEDIVKAFRENFDINELINNPEVKIAVFGGGGNNYFSLGKIYYALNRLGLMKEGKVVYMGKVSPFAEVGINDVGVFVEEKLVSETVESNPNNKGLINIFKAYFSPKLNEVHSS